ncbi:ADP-ribosyl cyclase/cyclic ADP-ribose hydrolase 1-like [Hydractinia symbiolongicarpus]|uniref:ADP-ribosyl cyclase/cyclic ADP-ribose hydrolase 1-like n=1 Tax=Hydractinia symbiolongicarpus TaxID=13093 RepID=UPI00254F077F|nr:ADP-ribosyl cyclase/cyclic ADP-ribose hydrolase 1-like [Hydractinia symbiolongicarpus]
MKLNQQFAVLFFILRHVNTYKPWNYNGSTPHLQELFTGRCWEYQLLDPVNREENLRVDVNCTEAWGLFRVAFATKNPCKNLTTADDYKMFFEKIKNTKHLSNKAMFWSGTRTIVRDFTHVNTDYVTLEDTFTGFVANNLDWCGCDTCPDGINTKFCDASCLYPTWSYWDSVSKQFAEKAADTVYVMVNGTSKGINTAYYRETTFGRIELPPLVQLVKLNIYPS